jgi:hypothetical protein
VHFQGTDVGAVKRGKLNSKKKAVHDLLGSTHMSLDMDGPEDCTLDEILKSTAKVFVADSGDVDISAIKADYEAMVRQAAAVGDASSPSPPGRKTMKDLDPDRRVNGSKALELVRADQGALNWILVGPDPKQLPLENAGGGSVEEMCESLKDTEVLFGMLRLGFGSGRFRRNHFVFIHWHGESVGAVKRGKANAEKSHMASALGPHSVELSASEIEECDLKAVIDKVRRACVVDGGGAGESEDPFSLEAYMAALAEDEALNVEMFGDGEAGAGAAGPSSYNFEETINLVRNSDSCNWALFAPN